MSKLRSLSTAFWSDPFIEDLSPIEKLLFIYLITNEKTNMLGIYEASLKKISFETGIEKDDVEKALKGFERLKKVKYIDNYVILVNYLKHQNFNTNMKKSAIDVYNNLPKKLKIKGIEVTKNNPLKGFETLLNHYGMVRKIEDEDEVEIEDEKEDEDELSDGDIFKPIETLKSLYLENEKLINAVISVKKNKLKSKVEISKRLEQFNGELKSKSIFQKTWNDYTSHFLNWHRKTAGQNNSQTDKSNEVDKFYSRIPTS